MDATIKKFLNMAVVLVVILWLLSLFGLLGSMSEPLIQLVIALLLVGVGLWLTNDYIPMDAAIKKILNVVLVIVLIPAFRLKLSPILILATRCTPA